MTENESRPVETAEDLYALKEDTEFCDGALAILTFPTAPPVGYLSYDNPKYFGTAVVPAPGVRVQKTPAGEFMVTR